MCEDKPDKMTEANDSAEGVLQKEGGYDLKDTCIVMRAICRGLAWNLRQIEKNNGGLGLLLTPEHMAAFKHFADWQQAQLDAAADSIQVLIDGLE